MSKTNHAAETIPVTLDELLGYGDTRLAEIMRNRFWNCRGQGFAVGMAIGAIIAAGLGAK